MNTIIFFCVEKREKHATVENLFQLLLSFICCHQRNLIFRIGCVCMLCICVVNELSCSLLTSSQFKFKFNSNSIPIQAFHIFLQSVLLDRSISHSHNTKQKIKNEKKNEEVKGNMSEPKSKSKSEPEPEPEEGVRYLIQLGNSFITNNTDTIKYHTVQCNSTKHKATQFFHSRFGHTRAPCVNTFQPSFISSVFSAQPPRLRLAMNFVLSIWILFSIYQSTSIVLQSVLFTVTKYPEYKIHFNYLHNVKALFL
jgi:hypothetical protein